MPKTWIFFFVMVVILVIASFLQSSNKSQIITPLSEKASNQVLPASREANADSMLKNGENTIYVTDQPSGQSTLTIAYAVFAKPGFITIRDNDHGMPGKIIGTSPLLQSGRSEKMNIDLTTVSQPDHVYYAELVQDDGDNVFVEEKDHLVSDQNKSIVLMSFQTSTAR